MNSISRFDRRVTVPSNLYTIFNQMTGGDKDETHKQITQALSEFVNGRIQIFDKAQMIVQRQEPEVQVKKRSVPSSWLD